MKKIVSCFLLASMLLVSTPIALRAETTVDPKEAATSRVPVSEEAKTLMNRLEVIDKMNKSELSRPERKALRKEVRTIKERLKHVGGGAYISVGALIIIILLLIILL